MKMKTSQILRTTTFYFCLVFTSLLFVNCSNDDDAVPPTFSFEDEFDDIDELPEVEDEDMATPDPDAGQVADSEETLAIVADVMGASSEADVAAENKAKLTTVNNFTLTQPAAVAEAAETLDEEAVDNLLNLSAELEGPLADLETALASVSAEVAALLPTIELSVDFEGMSVAALNKNGIVANDFDVIAQSQTGPCFVAANAAYEPVIQDLTAQRDARITTVEGNLTRRLTAADARLVTRTTGQEARLDENKQEVKATILSLLEAANNADSFDAGIASQLRQLALYYAVYARTALTEWNTAVLEMLETTKDAERAAAEERRDDRLAVITAAFASASAEAQAIRNRILNNCHNQGSGN